MAGFRQHKRFGDQSPRQVLYPPPLQGAFANGIGCVYPVPCFFINPLSSGFFCAPIAQRLNNFLNERTQMLKRAMITFVTTIVVNGW
jgi:hypothetical protein